MKKFSTEKIIVIVLVIIVAIIIAVTSYEAYLDRVQKQNSYLKAKQVSDEYYSNHPMTPSSQTIHYRDNNGYESEMTITDEGMKMRDNNGYKYEVSIDE